MLVHVIPVNGYSPVKIPAFCIAFFLTGQFTVFDKTVLAAAATNNQKILPIEIKKSGMVLKTVLKTLQASPLLVITLSAIVSASKS